MTAPDFRRMWVAFFATVQNEGKRKVEREIVYYNLDMIISVGYRVNSIRGVQFRMWATQVLKEYLIKGFALNDELLKNAGGGNYFDELLARIRDIRSSEKIFYRKVLEIYITFAGMVTDSSFMREESDPVSIFVRPLGRVILVSSKHPLNIFL